MRLRRLLPALLAALAFLAPRARADEWRMVFSISESETVAAAAGQASPPAAPQTYDLTVALGQRYFAAERHGRRTIYDFARRRVLVLDLAARTYDDWSLFAFVGNFVFELQNRLYLDSVASRDDRLGHESNLHLALPPKTPGDTGPALARTETADGVWEFRAADRVVAEFLPSTIAVPDAFYPRFGSFLAYELPVHPKIRREILLSGKIPERLTLRPRAYDRTTTVVCRLRSAGRAADDSSALPAEFSPATHAQDPLAALFRAVAQSRDPARPDLRALRAETERLAREAFAAHRPFDAYLALLECALQSGDMDRFTADLRVHRAEFESDPRFRAYAASLDQSTPESCRRGLASLDTIDRRDLPRAHLLDLQRADLLQKLGENSAAEPLFLSVLAANPSLAGAYHDLGKLYMDTWRYPAAWLCFDTARALAPDHALMREIAELEQRLRRDFPDFF